MANKLRKGQKTAAEISFVGKIAATKWRKNCEKIKRQLRKYSTWERWRSQNGELIDKRSKDSCSGKDGGAKMADKLRKGQKTAAEIFHQGKDQMPEKRSKDRYYT
jgi:hypothetical protein